MTTLAFVDLETSGLDPVQHEIIEVGIVLEDETGRAAEFECSLPFDIDRASPKALEVNGWGKRPFPEQWERLTAAARIAELTADCLFVGNCPWFDDAFLKVLFSLYGQLPQWHYHLVDVENLIAGLTGMRPPWNSKMVSAAVGVKPPTNQHSALADARWSRELYHRVFP